MRALLLVCFFAAIFMNVSIAQEDSGNALKRPLDLPAGGAGSDSEEEDVPETIYFYGSELEGDAFFWCVPAYSFCGDHTVWGTIKAEVSAAINQLTARVKFGLIVYNSETHIWQRRAKFGTGANKMSAISWMDTISTAETECLLPAGKETIRLCNSTKTAKKAVMVFMGGNAPACSTSGESGAGYAERCLSELTGANTKRHPINTIYVAAVYTTGQQFWRDLATANNGNYKEVQ